MGTIVGIILIIVGVGVIGMVAYVRYRISQFSREAFGTPDIIEGFRQQEAEYVERPKAVSGMTRLEVPKIEKDFPEFHWPEWCAKCEKTLREFLEAIEHQDVSYIKDAGQSLKDQARLRIAENKELGIEEAYDQFRVHQTEINRYEKSPGMCRIKVQSAVEYYYSRRGDKKKKDIENHKEQHRFNLELVYIQDITKLSSMYASSVSIHCPNCGGVLEHLGSRHCEYCGAGLEAFNTRIWSINRIDRAD